MRVRVLFFGLLADVMSRRQEELTLKEDACLADLLQHYSQVVPSLKDLLPALAVSVNQQYVSPSTLLHENDEVALLPPVSGGCAQSQDQNAALVREKIDAQQIASALKHSNDGACASFEGIVRDNSRGRRTLYLDYESYEPMALQQMQALIAEAKKKFGIREAAIIHRLGRLEIGETSVLIVVASAHRAAASDACRWLIDTLKKTVPIWKKEHFADGAIWADGEPFPPEIAHPQR
jgi:molybdopterin synthase catalytic subunit/molybdopterin converting factor small subunit